MTSEEVRQAWERGVDARLEQLDELLRVAALGAAPDNPKGSSDAGDAGDEDEFEPMFEHVGEWVEIYFAPTFNRHVSQSVRWCSSWWDHPEAYIRLEALWRSWEVHRLDAQRGMAVWFRDFLDGQLVTLFSAEGPFGDCTVTEHNDREPLSLTTAPEGWFTGPE